jgi:hypothetical protein
MTNPAPADTAPAGSRVFINLPHYRIDMFLAAAATDLVVTFEPMGRRKTFGEGREGWGMRFLQGLGYSVMAVMIKDCDWYRQADLAAFFAQMQARGFFRSFAKVSTYGGSMGGFAALAYADAVSADIVLSLNPQASLAAAFAPWESRFPFVDRRQWQDGLNNAAGGFKRVRQAYVIYDPWLALDAKQVQLLVADNPALVRLKVPAVGHGMPKWLAEMGLLKPTVGAILAGQFCLADFYQQARKRRTLRRYWQLLIALPRVAKSPLFTEIVGRYAAQYGFPYRQGTFALPDAAL